MSVPDRLTLASHCPSRPGDGAMSNFLVAVFGLTGFDAALDSAVRDTPSYHRAVAERHALPLRRRRR